MAMKSLDHSSMEYAAQINTLKPGMDRLISHSKVEDQSARLNLESIWATVVVSATISTNLLASRPKRKHNKSAKYSFPIVSLCLTYLNLLFRRSHKVKRQSSLPS